jgi:hypothetical protein
MVVRLTAVEVGDSWKRSCLACFELLQISSANRESGI